MSTDAHRGFGAPPPGQYGYPPQGQYGYPQQQGYPPPMGVQHPGGANFHSEATKSGEMKKDSNRNGMLAAGAGGLLVGGIAGAALAHDSDSDDGTCSCLGSQTLADSISGHATQAAPAGYGAPPAGYGYGAPPQGDPQPGDPQAEALEHNSDVSSSQRSSLEEAREDYEETQAAAADSDASSSDHEEAEEAREEYEEEIEEAQEDAED